MLCYLLLFEEPPPQTGEGNKRLYINVVANWMAYLFFIIFPYLVESETFPMERARFRFTPCKKFITNLTGEKTHSFKGGVEARSIGAYMQKGVKFRAYPNKEQQNLINQTLGCCRLIYNKGLAMRNEAYENGNKIGYTQTSAMLTELKKQDDFEFLKQVDSIALQQSLRDLDRGFINFFQKRAKHPVFKSKHNNHQSYQTINQGENIRIVGKYIKLPKLGYVKIKQSMEVGHIHHVTVERTPTGKYFVVLNVDFEPEFKPNNGGSIGIDVGIKEFYSDSNGNVVSNPKYLEKSTKNSFVSNAGSHVNKRVPIIVTNSVSKWLWSTKR